MGTAADYSARRASFPYTERSTAIYPLVIPQVPKRLVAIFHCIRQRVPEFGLHALQDVEHFERHTHEIAFSEPMPVTDVGRNTHDVLIALTAQTLWTWNPKSCHRRVRCEKG